MRAIVLTSIQYSDNSYIANLYTDSQGMVSVSIRTGSKRSKFRRSYLVPLTLLDVELSGRERSEIRYIADCTLSYNACTLSTDPLKILQSQFLAEMFHKALRTGEPDPTIFSFLRDSIIALDLATSSTLNTHLHILIKLMFYIGIMPDFTDFSADKVLDIAEGKMVYVSSCEYLNHDLSSLLINLASNPSTPLTSPQRRDLIDFLVRYYQRHLSGFGIIKTLDIFREMI